MESTPVDNAMRVGVTELKESRPTYHIMPIFLSLPLKIKALRQHQLITYRADKTDITVACASHPLVDRYGI